MSGENPSLGTHDRALGWALRPSPGSELHRRASPQPRAGLARQRRRVATRSNRGGTTYLCPGSQTDGPALDSISHWEKRRVVRQLGSWGKKKKKGRHHRTFPEHQRVGMQQACLSPASSLIPSWVGVGVGAGGAEGLGFGIGRSVSHMT